MSQIVPIDRQLGPAVTEMIQSLELNEEDVAAVRLAKHYADAIDQSGSSDTLAKLGPKLLTVLESLGATPKGRAVLAKAGVPDGPNPLTRFNTGRIA